MAVNAGGAPGGGANTGGGYAGGGGIGAERSPQRDWRLTCSDGRELDTLDCIEDEAPACMEDETLPTGGRGCLAFGPAGFFLKSLMTLSMLL